VIDWTKNGNLTMSKFLRICLNNDNPNIRLSNQDQELLDKLKLPNFIEKKKSKSPTLPPNPSSSSTNFKKPTVEIPPVDIDQAKSQDISKERQPGPSNSSQNLIPALILRTLKS
jgi:hypothetical protein